MDVTVSVKIKPFTRTTELPEILGISLATIYRRVSEGTLPPLVRLGGYGHATGYDYATVIRVLKGIPHDQPLPPELIKVIHDGV